MIPAINVTTLDGGLGRTLDTTKIIAMAGVASSGAYTPKTFARIADVIAEYTAGPLVDDACMAIKAFGIPVLCCRVTSTGNGTCSAVVRVGSGAVITVSSGAAPNNNYEPYVIFTAGGTRGSAGIKYKYSLDGGRTLSAEQELGTAVVIDFPASAGTIQFAIAAGDITAGEYAWVQATAPAWATADLTTAVEALAAHATQWDYLQVVGALTDDDVGAIELVRADMFNRGRDIRWMGGCPLPGPTDTDSDYYDDMVAEFTTNTTYGSICYGQCRLTSAVDSGKYRRSPLTIVGPFSQYVSEEQDIAQITLGPLLTCTITDDNGNPEDHDEQLNPGADDVGFLTLRTHSNENGVYVNNPRIFSAAGSDYKYIQNRRVVNLALKDARRYLRKRLSSTVRVSRNTGYITELDALEIEKGGNAVLRNTLKAKPKASDAYMVVGRTDNILSTETITVDISIIPLGYAKTINVKIGLVNPALTTV
jgi:hypothetical protein